jgi:long-subunit fatty acid transport protein
MVSNKAVDVKQTATGITPLLSLNIRPNDNLNIGIKYEFNTKLELVNETTADDIGIFPDGEKNRNDIPAILSFGLEYAILPEFRASVSANYFFDKNADWDGAEEFVDSNTYDIAFGFEYDLTKTILLSAGYLRTQISLSEEYQSDFSHELTSDTFGFGGRISVGENFDLDLGGLFTSYLEAERTFTDPLIGPYLEKYQRSNWLFTIGIGYHF